MNNPHMILKKAWQAVLAVAVVALIAAGSVFAATEFLSGGDCKAFHTDGILFTGSVSITGTTVEKWRDRVLVTITDPNGVEYTTGNDRVKELILYAASDSTPYQCQQLSSNPPNPLNSFSCNSFPKNGVIARVGIRFIPAFQGPNPTDPALPGKYTIKINSLVVTTDQLLDGHATIDAVSTACAWNMSIREWIPDPDGTPKTDKFVFNANKEAACHDGGVVQTAQTLSFKDEPGKAFTIVSLPLGEAFDTGRVRFYGDKVIKEFDYSIELNFKNNVNVDYKVTYAYHKGTNPADHSVNPIGFVPAAPWATVHNELPLRFVGGTIKIDVGALPFESLPTVSDFKFTFYYANKNPTLGYENSMFHFEREMSVVFSRTCDVATNLKYRTTSVAYDPCIPTKQVASISFTDATGNGYNPITSVPSLAGSDMPPAVAGGYIPTSTFAAAPLRNWYFEVERCKNATCTDKERQSDTYIHRIYVDDAEVDNRWWHYNATPEANMRRYTGIPLKTFQGAGRPFEIKQMDVTIRGAGTYFVRAMMPDIRMSGAGSGPWYPNNAMMEFYLTVPEKAGENTCSSEGSDGMYKVIWDGCGENYVPQTQKFEAVNEKYGFISNYSALTLEYRLNPSKSSLTSVAEIAELECEWQLLAEGYTIDGSGCYKDKIILPPFTRAIIKGGKIVMPVKPTFYQNDTLSEFVMAYTRRTTEQNTNLFINATDQECPREPIPDTGYSLRSPAPMSAADQSGFIFTGNTLEIPAIGLGTEYPIEIVHINYLNGKDLSGGYDLKVLGGYVGELEGGAYLPYPGNTVLTGHYYSQGVFVNLTSLHMEDEIIIYGTDGYKYTYRVNNSFWTKPDDAYMMFQPNGERSLTLVTCDDYNFIDDEYKKRYIVQATISSIEPYNKE